MLKFYTCMSAGLKPFYQQEIKMALEAFDQKNLVVSWLHLERAHVLAQPYPWQHSYVHWRMLLFGIRTKNMHEIIGQIPRLIFGGVKSFVGKIPTGNTGGANVPPLQKMEIDPELFAIIEKSKAF